MLHQQLSKFQTLNLNVEVLARDAMHMHICIKPPFRLRIPLRDGDGILSMEQFSSGEVQFHGDNDTDTVQNYG